VLIHDLDAQSVVGLGGVVTIGESGRGRCSRPRVVVGLEELIAALEGGGDAGAAILADGEEGLLVHLLGADIVDDVAALDALVVAAEPGVDPEASSRTSSFCSSPMEPETSIM
jgi:hypothetical protein